MMQLTIRRFVTYFILICLFVFVFIFFILPKIQQSSPRSENSENNNGSAEISSVSASPVKVEAAPVQRGELIIRVSASGQAKAIRQIAIVSETSGAIVDLPIFEGKYVQKNDVLINLDDRDYQLNLAEPRHKLLKARAEYEIKCQIPI